LGRGKGALLQVMDLGLKKNLESLSPVLENRPTSLRTGTTAHDTVTGNCDDSYLVENLRAGTYTLALAVWDNVPNGNLSDGFRQDGNPGFTCAEFSLGGNFCDTTTALGVARTAKYALSISGHDVVGPATVPEPSTLALFGADAAMTVLFPRARVRSARN
jgi:hypothetical protein